jgi:hypothetical protein
LRHGVNAQQSNLTGLRVDDLTGHVTRRLAFHLSDEDLLAVIVATFLDPGFKQLLAARRRKMWIEEKPRISVRSTSQATQGGQVGRSKGPNALLNRPGGGGKFSRATMLQREANIYQQKSMLRRKLGRFTVISVRQKIETSNVFRPAPGKDGRGHFGR